MLFLDVFQLFFEPYISTLEVRPQLLTKNIFGKEWDVTLEYVLHQPGLNAAYTSDLSKQHDLWVFLVWSTEEDRHHFYKQTTGFSFMSNHMTKPPSVFLFGDGLYDQLDATRDWTIAVMIPEAGDGNILTHEFSVGELQNARLVDGHHFVAQQEKEVIAQLYDGNHFDHATTALIKTSDLMKITLECEPHWKQYSFELHKCEKNLYPSPANVEAPANIAELAKKQPWEYGVLSLEDSKYSDTAYPMNLMFRPMSTLSMADKFHPEPSGRSNVELAATNDYAMCIVEFIILPHCVESGAALIDYLRTTARLQDGVDGLRELSVLTKSGYPDRIKFFAVWQTTSHFEQWRDIMPSVCNSVLSWTSGSLGLPKLYWDNMPLMLDNQAWQKVDKILEIVEFTFVDPLAPAEQEAFQDRVYDLINTMSSCWSGDIDSKPVVHAEEPVWIDPQGRIPRCLLILAWDGTEQRAAWLRNFMAQKFTWAGYIAHALGRICCKADSMDFKIEKLYSGCSDEATPPNEQDQDENDDSDRDMGF